MVFSCRNCKEKFNLTNLMTKSKTASNSYSVVSTQCGHLFHQKCLEGVLTNQKLLHARHGTGPFRRFCPVPRCNVDIESEDSLVKLEVSDDESLVNPESESNSQDAEVKLIRRVQMLMSEKGKLLENLEKADNEVELLRYSLDEIKFDLSEIQSFLKDDNIMKKGDLIFWITKDGTYAPGKILEIRKKPGENVHYAIVKLDKKTKVSGIGPHSVARDTLILPVTELTTFKSFFREFFDKFQAKFEALIVDLNTEIQEMSSPLGSQSSDRGTSYYRSTRKLSRSISKTNVGVGSLNALNELDSVSVESIPIPTTARKSSQPALGVKTTNITRSRTIHYGAGNEPRRLEKCRSNSWATPPTTTLDSPTTSVSSRSFPDLSSPTLEEEDIELEVHNEFIREGERVIWFDTFSEYEQVGTVAAVCEFSPCAIVKFDIHPIVKHKFQYRTVPLDELFPYDLASPEDKFRIAEAYGQMSEFVTSHEHMFVVPNDESTSEFDGD